MWLKQLSWKLWVRLGSRSIRLLDAALELWIWAALRIQQFIFSRGFDYGICGIVFLSVSLILLNILGISQIHGISIIELDFLLFSLLLIEYCLKLVFAPGMLSQLSRSWHEIPGMIPLLAFELIPHSQFWGLTRLFRLTRFFVLLKSDLARKLMFRLTEELSSRVALRLLEMIRLRIYRELDSAQLELRISQGVARGISDLIELLGRTQAKLILNPVLTTAISRRILEQLQHSVAQITLKFLDQIDFREMLKQALDRIFQELERELRK